MRTLQEINDKMKTLSKNYRQQLKSLIQEHSEMVDAKHQKVHDIVDSRHQLARETKIIKKVWSFYDGRFMHRSKYNYESYDESAAKIGVLCVESIEEDTGKNTIFTLNGKRYRFYQTTEEENVDLEGEEFGSLELCLYDQEDQCILEFTVNNERVGLGSERRPLGWAERFVPGSWVGEVVAASELQKSLKEIRMKEYYESDEKISNLKDRYGIK